MNSEKYRVAKKVAGGVLLLAAIALLLWPLVETLGLPKTTVLIGQAIGIAAAIVGIRTLAD